MSSPAASVYIVHLQAIPPSLFFMVPLATIILFFLAISHTVVQHRHDPILIHIQLLDRRKKRVAWVFPVVFSLALLAILAGALLFFRARSESDSPFLAVADTVVTSVLYVELSVSVMYLLSVVVHFAAIQPVVFFIYCMALAIILISATLVSIVGPFRAVPPLISPILYLTTAVLTIPVITFSFLSSLHPSEASLAPQITLSSTCSFPSSSSEKPQLLEDVPPSLEISHTTLTERYATRNIAICILCGQISAIIHFAFAIGILVLLPDQSSLPSTLTSEEMLAGVWVEALAFRIVQTAFLVVWIICLIAAFLPSPPLFITYRTLFARKLPAEAHLGAHGHVGRNGIHVPPPRTHRPRSKSRSSSFSSPRPRRAPVFPRPHYVTVRRGPSPLGAADDCQNLHDPFASPAAHPGFAAAFLDADGARPTRMSTWGTLPPPIPPRPPPNVLVINPPARRLPSLGALRGAAYADSGVSFGGRRSLSMFSYTTPSAYSQDGDEGYDGAFDVEEALLAQKLLRRLDAAGAGGWKLGRNGSVGSAFKGRRP
ncbi:hypothetical protein B0H17DRAFT_1286811 [Mycena rosella]|uniref:Uncharacterized protein n=1 Tax=Mycena rosella TaxID=1033263 RepID=A0AAD7GHL4_MYCRO|nr:hypothetical protein B0H17DRAFT_1286811 [Mycena rosella]